MSVNLGNDTKATSPVRTPDEGHKESKYEPKQNKKIVRLLTVIAYVISVSMAAMILSLYYVFLWDPQLKYNETSIDLSKEVHHIDTSPFTQPEEGDGRIESANNYDDSNPTPKVMALMPEPSNYYTGQKSHSNGQTTQFTNMHHNTGSSPQHQDIPPETSPTGSPYVADAIQNEQEHGQPPLPAASA